MMCKHTLNSLRQILVLWLFFFFTKSKLLSPCMDVFNDSVKIRQLNSVNHEIDCFAKILKNQTGHKQDIPKVGRRN